MLRARGAPCLRTMTDRVTSVQNPRIKQFRKLHRARERRETGLTIVEGRGAVAAAFEAGSDIDTLLVLDENEGVATPEQTRLIVVDPHVMAAVAGTETPRGPVAILRIPEWVPVRAAPTLVVWGTSEPGNVGTLIRSATAFGFDVTMGPDGSDPWNPTCIRAGAGAHFAARLSRVGAIAVLRAASLRPVALVASGGAGLDALEAHVPIALVVGNEAHGLAVAITEECDQTVTISTAEGVESLNVAAAGAIAMHRVFAR